MGLDNQYGVNTLDDNSWKLIEKFIINEPNLKWEDAPICKDTSNGKWNCNGEIDENKRNSRVAFLDYYEELDKLFGRMVLDYNNNYSGWEYDIKMIEAIQVTEYSEGQFYGWHKDSFDSPEIKDDHLWNRKVSATVWLNDPEEYEGGEFDLEVRGPDYKQEGEEERYDTFKLPKKSIILFPSDKWHRVRPVTSGVRKSLVLWIQGPPFR